MAEIHVQSLAGEALEAHADALAEIIAQTVNDGAAIGFMQPFDEADGRAFFEGQVFPEVRAGRRRLIMAWLDGVPAGSVQLIVTLPANQPHRSEVAKMMVAPAARRRGVGRALMAAVDTAARDLGKRLITLDTRTGDVSEPLYRTAGFVEAGVIPGYALDPDGKQLHATTYMYKTL
ncbi:Sortase [Hoeflea phototrophica DFL-43]|uniref:Sortase n=1 Tax=Hoeflea phototrophica (strain DSM 17068 / NCIMB 14078 / DFL-43) TaxID=411684 RepID=A9CWV3_HOEPD|nr:GNAT family N-acetyltransferase [Hoeflea phototrophica]EDQ35574.1 Sortase [Hoeflea phototrophica DFL-43]